MYYAESAECRSTPNKLVLIGLSDSTVNNIKELVNILVVKRNTLYSIKPVAGACCEPPNTRAFWG